MEKQVLSVKQMRELQELGIDISKASCTWCKVRAITSDRKGYSWMILPETLNKFDEEHVPTFTLQDILEMLPKVIVFEGGTEANLILWEDSLIYYETAAQMSCLEKRGKNMLEAAFNMLKWLKQNNYI